MVDSNDKCHGITFIIGCVRYTFFNIEISCTFFRITGFGKLLCFYKINDSIIIHSTFLISYAHSDGT